MSTLNALLKEGGDETEGGGAGVDDTVGLGGLLAIGGGIFLGIVVAFTVLKTCSI
jgi:hypothetical protein